MQEIGEWGVSGDLYIVITRGWINDGQIDKTDTTDPYYWDVYEVKKLSNNEFHYKSLKDNVLYKTRRVPAGFDFPE